ncbi:MAG: uridine kinase [Bdellovibrionota bacterium]
MKRVVVGIAGGSGSGKTTLAQMLKDLLGARAKILYQDSYYIDQSHRFDGDGGSVNFDHPKSLEFSLLAAHMSELKSGKVVEVPQYDFSTHKRLKDTAHFACCEVVIVDGTLLLSQEGICQALDIKVFVDTPEALRFSRRLERDVCERGRTPEGVKKQFDQQVKPMHDLFVEPSKDQADFLFSGELDVRVCAEKLVREIAKFL